MERTIQTGKNGASDTVLWTPWGPVPDAARRPQGNVSRLNPRGTAPRHKMIGFDLRPRDGVLSRQ